jgi:hypothetical protein
MVPEPCASQRALVTVTRADASETRTDRGAVGTVILVVVVLVSAAGMSQRNVGAARPVRACSRVTKVALWVWSDTAVLAAATEPAGGAPWQLPLPLSVKV